MISFDRERFRPGCIAYLNGPINCLNFPLKFLFRESFLSQICIVGANTTICFGTLAVIFRNPALAVSYAARRVELYSAFPSLLIGNNMYWSSGLFVIYHFPNGFRLRMNQGGKNFLNYRISSFILLSQSTKRSNIWR